MRSSAELFTSGVSHVTGNLSREEFVHELKNRLSGQVERAYLFGSLARGDWSPTSDVDLILVLDTTLPFLERYREFTSIFDLTDRLDLLVYTPEEFSPLVESPSPGFWKSVVQEMVRIV